MKSFKFPYGDNYEVVYRDGELEINEYDEWGNYVGSVTIPMAAMLAIHAEAEKLFPLHNPNCTDVLDARSKLEAARDICTTGHNERFDEALKAYVDVSSRHREAFKCEVFH